MQSECVAEEKNDDAFTRAIRARAVRANQNSENSQISGTSGGMMSEMSLTMQFRSMQAMGRGNPKAESKIEERGKRKKYSPDEVRSTSIWAAAVDAHAAAIRRDLTNEGAIVKAGRGCGRIGVETLQFVVLFFNSRIRRLVVVEV